MKAQEHCTALAILWMWVYSGGLTHTHTLAFLLPFTFSLSLFFSSFYLSLSFTGMFCIREKRIDRPMVFKRRKNPCSKWCATVGTTVHQPLLLAVFLLFYLFIFKTKQHKVCLFYLNLLIEENIVYIWDFVIWWRNDGNRQICESRTLFGSKMLLIVYSFNKRRGQKKQKHKQKIEEK